MRSFRIKRGCSLLDCISQHYTPHRPARSINQLTFWSDNSFYRAFRIVPNSFVDSFVTLGTDGDTLYLDFVFAFSSPNITRIIGNPIFCLLSHLVFMYSVIVIKITITEYTKWTGEIK